MKKNTTRKMSIFLSICICLFSLSSFAQDNHSLLQVKDFLQLKKSSVGLTDEDISSLSVKKEFIGAGTGIKHIYAEQKLNGLSITGTNYSLHVLGNKKVDAFGLISLQKYKSKALQTSISAADAVGILMQSIHYPESRTLSIKQAPKGVEKYTIFSRNTTSIWDIPCRMVYYKSDRLRSLIPAWEVQMMDVYKSHYWVAYIDVAKGKILDKKDLIVRCDFGSSMVTDYTRNGEINPKEFTLTDADNGKSVTLSQTTNHTKNLIGANNKYRVFDMPYESPIDPGATHTLVTHTGDPLSSPDGWHKVANTTTYQFTRGNNVWAFQDPSPGPLGGLPSADPTRTAYANNGVMGAPPLTEPFEFDYPVDLNSEPENYMMGAIVNLFYWNNLMHDVFYYFGFNEDAGNFQDSPIFSTGTRSTNPTATSPDYVLAQAQDGGGTNNANFLTLPDGTNGQMQMYLWTAAAPDSLVQIISSTSGIPPSGSKIFAVQGSFNTVPVEFTNLYTNPVLNKEFVIVQKNALSTLGSSSEGCSTGQQSIALPPSNDVTDKIVLIDRGNCSFVEKVLGAQMGGAAGVIIINNVDGPPVAIGGTDPTANGIIIPAVMISKASGEILKNAIQGGATIIGSLKRDAPPTPKRDGDIDNGVISHEYGHGISNRLTGGGSALSPLGGDEQGGEGWSDFLALYMTLRTNDLEAPTGSHPNGVLPNRSIGNYVTYQPYNGRGIREYPYSSDLSINPATFGYILRPDYSETHSVGFVWCSMLYELMQSFVDQYGMSDEVYEGADPVSGNPPATAKGNNIVTRLVMEGMKYQPESPTFVQERDAILKADTLLYNAQHSCMIWTAFAKRGLGYSAISGTNSLGDEVEAFDVPFACDPTQKRIRIVKSGSSKVDNNANITYTLTITNILPGAITGVTIADTLDANLTFISASDAPVVNGKIVTWTLDLGANETKVLSLTTKVVVGTASTVVFEDDQEAGSGNWDNSSSFPLSSWTYKDDATQSFSGSKYWFTPDVDLGGSNVSLTSSIAYNVSAASELVFFHKYNSESGYDGGVVEISTDNVNWTYLPPTAFVKGNYNSLIPTADNPFIGLNDLAAFSGASNGYIVSIASLAEYAGQDIYIRFRFTADATGGMVDGGGWWIDDVYILDNRIEVGNTAFAHTNLGGTVYETEGENAFSATSAFVLDVAIVPLTLTDFTGLYHNNAVELKWNVSNEQSILRYEIERRSENNNDFEWKGSVDALNLSANHLYQFEDRSIVSGEKYYYRLKIVSQDGSVTYSNNVFLKIPGGNLLKVSLNPNPVRDVANILINNPSGKMVKLGVFNVSGKKVAELNGGTQTEIRIPMSVSMLSTGTYWIQVTSANETSTLKMIIAR